MLLLGEVVAVSEITTATAGCGRRQRESRAKTMATTEGRVAVRGRGAYFLSREQLRRMMSEELAMVIGDPGEFVPRIDPRSDVRAPGVVGWRKRPPCPGFF